MGGGRDIGLGDARSMVACKQVSGLYCHCPMFLCGGVA